MNQCGKCRRPHERLSLARWCWQWRHLADKPTSVQSSITRALADRLHAGSGCGFVSLQQLADDTGRSMSTIQRVIRWAVSVGLIEQAARGHRLGDGRVMASEWRLNRSGSLISTGQDEQSQPVRTDISTGQSYDHPSSNPSPVNPVPASDAFASALRDEELAMARRSAAAQPDTLPGMPAMPGDGAEDDPSTGTLVATWIDHCVDGHGRKVRPPGRVIGQVSRELKIMLDEGIPYDDVLKGLARWHLRKLHPSALASAVHEIRLGVPVIGSGRSATDDRVNAGLALAARYAAEEAEQDASRERKAITR
jgi:hypothetical protein